MIESLEVRGLPRIEGRTETNSTPSYHDHTREKNRRRRVGTWHVRYSHPSHRLSEGALARPNLRTTGGNLALCRAA